MEYGTIFKFSTMKSFTNQETFAFSITLKSGKYSSGIYKASNQIQVLDSGKIVTFPLETFNWIRVQFVIVISFKNKIVWCFSILNLSVLFISLFTTNLL